MGGTWIFLVLLLLKLDTSTFGILFEYRLRCPDTQEKWDENTNSYVCHGNKVYHCMQEQDGHYVVFCASRIWIQPDYCPEFNKEADSLIDVILCQGNVGECPENQYLSNTVYKYPSCFRTVVRSTRPSPPSVDRNVTTTNPWNTRQPKQESDGERDSTDSTAVILGIIAGIVLPILVFLAITFLVKWRKLKRKTKASHDEEGTCITVPNDKEGSKADNNKNEEENEDPPSETQSLLRNSTRNDNEREPGSEAAFIRPRLYNNAVTKLKEDGFIIIVGGPGSGKTTLAHVIVNEEFKDYCVFHMKPKQKELPEMTGNKDAVIWDDCFGIWNVCDLEENITACVRNNIFELIERCKREAKCKALICIDPFFDKDDLFAQLSKNVIDLADNYVSLHEKEKLTTLFDKNIYMSKVSDDVGFPLLIGLILEQHCPMEKAEEFLEKPIKFLSDNYNNLFENEKDMYITLVYVLCNSPSVNLRDINWKSFKKLREECQNNDDNDGQHRKESDQNSTRKEGNQFDVILGNSKGMKMNTILAKYLVETEDPGVFRFRHHFLEHLLLCYHVGKVGNKGVLTEGNEEIKYVVKNSQSPLRSDT